MTGSSTTPSPEARLEAVRNRIETAARGCGRDPEGITLIGVAKTFPATAIRDLAAAGLRRFAESYAQEALTKMEALNDLDLEWHFVGPIQTNKAKHLAPYCDWVHSVDRLKVARALDRYRGPDRPLDICLQVNTSGEPSKSGCTPEELREFAEAVAQECTHLRLRGLLTLPAPTRDPKEARSAFQQLAALLADLQSHGPSAPWDTLSMGMSHDLEVAITEGATHVRIGTALFGRRE